MTRLTPLSRPSAVFVIVGMTTAGLLAAAPSGLHAKALDPAQDGQNFCIAYDDGENGYIPNGPNSCCFEEEQNPGGDLLKICVYCDREWKNCATNHVLNKIDRSNSQGKSSGTVAEPPRAPKTNILKPQGTISN